MHIEEKLRQILACEGIAASIEKETDEHAPDYGCVLVDLHGRCESFAISSEQRYGKDGFRVLRYIVSDNTIPMDDWKLDWDGWFQFHTSLEAFVRAVCARDYSESRKAF